MGRDLHVPPRGRGTRAPSASFPSIRANLACVSRIGALGDPQFGCNLHFMSFLADIMRLACPKHSPPLQRHRHSPRGMRYQCRSRWTMKTKRTSLLVGLILAFTGAFAAMAQPPGGRRFPPPIGPYVNLKPDDFARRAIFRSDGKIVMTHDFYWYDVRTTPTSSTATAPMRSRPIRPRSRTSRTSRSPGTRSSSWT